MKRSTARRPKILCVRRAVFEGAIDFSLVRFFFGINVVLNSLSIIVIIREINDSE
jgi:hypothetical protein